MAKVSEELTLKILERLFPIEETSMEEVEPVEELSKNTLRNYIARTDKDLAARGALSVKKQQLGDNKESERLSAKNNRRVRSADKAIDKFYAKEETETLDELSKATLGSYVKKASKDAASSAAISAYADADAIDSRNGDARRRSYKQSSFDHDRTRDKRIAGISKAVDRLTK